MNVVKYYKRRRGRDSERERKQLRVREWTNMEKREKTVDSRKKSRALYQDTQRKRGKERHKERERDRERQRERDRERERETERADKVSFGSWSGRVGKACLRRSQPC